MLRARKGQGEWVELAFGAPVRLQRLLVRNGLQNPTWFDKFNRVKTLELVFSDGERRRVELADSMDEQAVDLGGRSSTWLRLVIVDVYKCLPFYNPRTTCLSELAVVAGEGPAPEAAAPAPAFAPGGVRMAASSSLFAAGQVKYEPENLLDGDPKTCWAVGGGEGAGEWAEARFDGPRLVDSVGLRNGDQRPGAYGQSNRVAKARLVLSDGTETRIELKDTPDLQVFKVPANPTTSLRLVIDSPHLAEQWRHRRVTSLSEMEIASRPAQGQAPKAAKAAPAAAAPAPAPAKAALAPVPAPEPPRDAKPSATRPGNALLGDFKAGSEAVAVIQQFYRRLVTLDDAFPQLFAERVREQEAYVFEIFREYQRKRKTFEKLRNALLDLDKLDMKFQSLDTDRVRVEVTGVYTIYVADTYEDIKENTVFVLLNESGSWRILERQDGAASGGK